jgi:hypothetical protein
MDFKNPRKTLFEDAEGFAREIEVNIQTSLIPIPQP